DELAVKQHAPHARSQEVTPPTPFAQTCNIAYPRALLEQVGGFDEALPLAAGEDTDLALRVQALGAPLVAAPEVLTYHAVEATTLPARLRETWRWQHLAYIVRRHPQLREQMPLRLFWKPSHAYLIPALAGLGLARRHPLLAALLVLSWALVARPSYGSGPRGLARPASEPPAARRRPCAARDRRGRRAAVGRPDRLLVHGRPASRGDREPAPAQGAPAASAEGRRHRRAERARGASHAPLARRRPAGHRAAC